jgi:CBS domain-containing protein
VAETIAHYNLLAVPVVDDEGRLRGIVTVDDAIDTVAPTSWRRRLPRVFARPEPAADEATPEAPAAGPGGGAKDAGR